MGKIKVAKCPIEGLYIIEPTVFVDSRGISLRHTTRTIWKKPVLTLSLFRRTFQNL